MCLHTFGKPQIICHAFCYCQAAYDEPLTLNCLLTGDWTTKRILAFGALYQRASRASLMHKMR